MRVKQSKQGNDIARVKGKDGRIKWMRVIPTLEDAHVIPGRHGVTWDNYLEGLERNAPYDVESMMHLRKLGGVRRLVERMMPALRPDRKEQLVKRIEAACHRRQREWQGADDVMQVAGLAVKTHRAKRWSKSKRRKDGGNALNKLKRLLRK